MKCLLVFPPQSMPENPYLSTALLKSLLCKNNHPTEQLDLNIRFYNHILKPEYIKNTLDKLYEDYEKNAEELFSQYEETKNLEDYTVDFRNQYLKYKKLKEIDKQQAYESINNVENYVNIIKTGKKKYAKTEIMQARSGIWNILGYLFLPYFDEKIINNKFFYFIRNFDQLKDFLDESKNIYYEFYEDIIPEIVEKNLDYIGISIAAQSQMLPGLTLARLLKQKTNAHISIGGSYISRIIGSLKTKPEFFELFADSVMYEEGETPVLELMKHLEGKINIEQVPNLLYLKDGKVEITEKTQTMALNEIPIPDFADFPMESYYTSKITAPMLAERGCYWSKCTFCDVCYTGNKYDFKNPEKVVSEVKELIEKHGFSQFFFVCEAMSPAYLRKLSNEIIKADVKIEFIIYARVEKEFTEELLALAKKAGVKEIMWGVESVNERILGLMNKTNFVDKDGRLEVIKRANQQGIQNTCFFILGFPGETREEAEETLDFIRQNKKFMTNILVSNFNVREHSLVTENPEKFSIKEMGDKEEFDLYYYQYETSSGMSSAETIKLVEDFCNELYLSTEIPYYDMHDLVYASVLWGF